ncbi:hypothetical protein Hden_1157 [Hyphomicrobium denitrificans ATCC 51888]|uniref:Uncharacterized protein n=1 Tax=Hyphomicrobium denitrificans (strain ATCC 51888 / DSM 1869 / NCIMB 11706 / TK 0415) TaxID=582899 RepID=D8JVT2_HYPDA|nr:hypothetical protein Hden_1157 [Hyphomicrobium denitrificans ATCC 51888]
MSERLDRWWTAMLNVAIRAMRDKQKAVQLKNTGAHKGTSNCSKRCASVSRGYFQ